MQRFSERERIQIALVFALGLALVYLLVISPLLTAAYRTSSAERMRAETLLARMDAYHRADAENRDEERVFVLRHAFLARALPEERAQGAFLHDAETYARAAGVTIEGVTQQPPEEQDDLVLLPIEMHVRGDYFALLSFLRALQEGPRAVQFVSCALTAEGREGSAVLTVQIAALHTEEQDALRGTDGGLCGEENSPSAAGK